MENNTNDTHKTSCKSKRISGPTALLLGIAAGYTFLLCLAWGMGIMSNDFVVFAACGLTIGASLIPLLSKK